MYFADVQAGVDRFNKNLSNTVDTGNGSSDSDVSTSGANVSTDGGCLGEDWQDDVFRRAEDAWLTPPEDDLWPITDDCDSELSDQIDAITDLLRKNNIDYTVSGEEGDLDSDYYEVYQTITCDISAWDIFEDFYLDPSYGYDVDYDWWSKDDKMYIKVIVTANLNNYDLDESLRKLR